MTRNSTPSRIVASGISASAALVLVGAMAASARSAQVTPAPPTPVIEQFVTIQIPALVADTNDAMAIDTTEQFDAQVTVVREVRTVPAPASNPVRAPAPTEGS